MHLSKTKAPLPRQGAWVEGGGGPLRLSKHSCWHSLHFPLFSRWPPTITTLPKGSEVMEAEFLDLTGTPGREPCPVRAHRLPQRRRALQVLRASQLLASRRRFSLGHPPLFPLLSSTLPTPWPPLGGFVQALSHHWATREMSHLSSHPQAEQLISTPSRSWGVLLQRAAP